VKKLSFSTNISLYFANNTRYDRSYNSRRIETQCDLSNGGIFSNPERLVTHISRWRQ